MKATDRHITCQMCGTKFTGHFMRKFCDSCKLKADRKRSLESYHRNKHAINERRNQWRKDNPELAKEKDREHRKRNHASVKRAQVNFHKRNPNARSKYHIKYIARMKAEEPEKLAAQRKRNHDQRDPEKRRASCRKSFLKYRDKINANKRERGYSANYKARRKDAILPSTCKKKIASIWRKKCRLSDSTGIEYHVDHIIPLAIGGAHHQDNLRIITAEENLSKSKKYNPALSGVWADNDLAKQTKLELGI